MIKIALDAMGGDFGHCYNVEAAVNSATDNLNIFLIGNKNILKKELKKYPYNKNIFLYNADEKIEMKEEPIFAYKKKKKASIVVATKLVKHGICDAVVSAGNTGAQMVSAIFELGRLATIKKPAIITYYPTEKGIKILLDVGATPDCDKNNLYQFAILANIFSKYYLKIKSPKIGLLNIGTENKKGNILYKETYCLLEKNRELNFYGNIEGRDIPKGIVDIVICDGFVGNIVIKLMEGLVNSFVNEIKKNIYKSIKYRIGGFLLKNIFYNLKQKLDYSEYGGAPLLGVNGISIVCHGNSNTKTMQSAIFAAKNLIQSGFQKKILEYFEGLEN